MLENQNRKNSFPGKFRLAPCSPRTSYGWCCYVLCLALALAHGLPAKGQRPEKLIDSIENLNIWAHDTVKIKNYLLLVDKIGESHPDTALFYISRGIELAGKKGNETYLGHLLYNKGVLYENARDYTRALELFKQSLELAQRDNHPALVVSSYNRLGNVYIDLNILDEAFNSLIEGLKICDKEKDPYMYSIILNNLGVVHNSQKKYDRALDYFIQSLSINKKFNILSGIALSYNNIGGIYFALNKLDSVLIYYKKALEIFEELEDIKTQSAPLYNIAEVYFIREEFNNAISYTLKSYEIDKQFNDIAGMAKSLHMLGRVYSKKGFYKYGMELYRQALAFSLEANDKIEQKELYLDMADNYEAQGKLSEALEFYKLHSQLKDTVYDLGTSRLILELETKYLTEQQRRENEVQRILIEAQQAKIRQKLRQNLSLAGGIILLLVISLIIYRSYRIKTRSNIVLQRQKDQIESQNFKITSSIQYARLIQTASLPPTDMMLKLFNEHFVLYLPRDIVSGDFFWAAERDGYAVIACADCTGHGVPGAFMSMLGVSFLTEIVNRVKYIKPDIILEELRKNIIGSLHQTGKIGESRDGMDIALCVFNPARTQLEYAGAFMPLAVIRDGALVQIAPNKMPIGIHDDVLRSFTPHRIKLLKNDMLSMYTDGYTGQ